MDVPEEDLFQGENGMWYFLTKIDDRHISREREEGADGGFRLNAVKNGDKMADIPVLRQTWHGR